MTEETEALKDVLRHQANVRFPAAARAGEGYPIRFNHCFLRVVYDNLLGAQWQTVLKRKEPAIHQLTAEQLERAIAIGEQLIEDPEVCRELNRRSLTYRGKA